MQRVGFEHKTLWLQAESTNHYSKPDHLHILTSLKHLMMHFEVQFFHGFIFTKDHRGGARTFIKGVGGGGGVCKRLCARTHIMSVKPEVPYGRGPGPA